MESRRVRILTLPQLVLPNFMNPPKIDLGAGVVGWFHGTEIDLKTLMTLEFVLKYYYIYYLLTTHTNTCF